MGLEALLSSQIIGLSEAIDDRTASLLVAGTGITLTYNDGAGTLTIANTGLGGSTGSTDNRILRSDGTGGATVQNSAVTIDDSGNISGLGTVGCGAITSTGQLRIAYSDTTGGDNASPTMSIRNTSENTSWVTSQIRVLVGTGYPTFPEVWLEATRNAVWGNVTMLRTVSNHPLDFATSDVRRMRITASGRLLCNTTTDDETHQVQVNGGLSCVNLTSTGVVSVGTYTVATLPSAAANGGRLAQVTDSSVTTNGSAVAGGGSSRVVVFSNGTTWNVVVA
jgi:hypothetical protein